MFELARSIQARDPAEPSLAEVMLCYNGYHAVMAHRVCNKLWRAGFKLPARFLANMSRMATGVEIHPEAKIGKNLFIDHGTGLVIGQTAEVGDNVEIYHNVTLGGIEGHRKGARRHPVVEDNVMIGAGAQILGPITIHEGAQVGANSVVTKDVPANSTALGIPARILGKDFAKTAYGIPVDEKIESLAARLENLEKAQPSFQQRISSNKDNGMNGHDAPGNSVERQNLSRSNGPNI